MTRPAPWDAGRAEARIEALRHLPGAMLPILHALQETFGYIDKAAVPLVAEALNVSRAEVHGVVSFYHDFRERPAGRHVLKVCRAEACQAMGCERLVQALEERLQVTCGGTTANGDVTLEAVYCLGNCALSPAVMLDGALHGRVTPETLDPLIAEARRQP